MGKEHGELHLEGFNGPDLEWHTSPLFQNVATGLRGTMMNAEECSSDVELRNESIVRLLLGTSSCKQQS